MYIVTCFGFFFTSGLIALFIRAELAAPGLQFLSNEQYNQLFTMHGTIMLLFYATPIVVRVRQHRAAPADRRPRCRIPATERVVVLAVFVRRADHHLKPNTGLRLNTGMTSVMMPKQHNLE